MMVMFEGCENHLETKILTVRSLIEQSSSFRKMVQQEAVVVRNATKCYGKGQLVLDGLNMIVSRGSIYGLLGASGCGKTTLLSCIVGVRYLDSGEIWVLGGTPGSKGSGIPGPRVGYMPQEISLVGEFSVSSALYYFGRINGLDDEEIETRQRFFSELFELPPSNCLVQNMSGGQQRRVSFAAALIHRPELLILDEPTVGLDPLLRENIWAYLIKITQEEGTTVLITTHYVEETKDADKIGLMRRGKLLAESPPQQLLERFQCSFLEEAFLQLCETQENSVILSSGSSGAQETDSSSDAFRGLAFAVIFPLVQIAALFIGVGNDPKDLKIGIVNDEAGNCNYGSNLGNVWNDEITCHFGNLSCRFPYSTQMLNQHLRNIALQYCNVASTLLNV